MHLYCLNLMILGSQQPIGSRRTTGETPLASIKPMTSGVRTAAVLPNAQYSTATSIHHHSMHTSGILLRINIVHLLNRKIMRYSNF